MRRRISLLVAATSSAIIVAFIVPMCLLVQTLAEDRATATAQQQAQGVAVIVSSVGSATDVAVAVSQVAQGRGYHTTVVLPTGQIIGSPPSTEEVSLVQQAQQRGSAFTDHSGSGATVLVPIALDAGTAVVLTHVTGEAMHQGVTTAWASIGGLGLVLLALALLVARRLAERIATPVTELARVAHLLRTGDMDARVEPAGPEEVQEVGTAFNQLAERIDDLLAAEREVVADLSHRLRTPVTALRLDSESVRDPETAERLRAHVDQLQRTVDAVVLEARRPVRAAMRGECDAVAVAADRVRFWEPLASDQERTITFDAPEGALRVGLADVDLRDLLDNLLDNIFAHTPDGAGIVVTVRSTGTGAGGGKGGVEVLVADAGPGFPEHDDSARRGSSGSGSTGLGLDIVRRIARTSGGSASLGRTQDGGALVTVVLGRAH
ncbi:MAG: HAMP domain-containing sensor histidine kinase [Pedococcus sp.]